MFTLKISTANAAFEDEGAEVARILREVAKQLANGMGRADDKQTHSIRDVNGNTVGKWSLT